MLKPKRTVLIISADYPPEPGIGSLNVSKITKYLLRFGWVPVVLTAPLASDLSVSLPLEIPEEMVHYVPWPDNNPQDRLKDSLLKNLLYLLIGNVGWYFPAVKRGLELIREYRPGIIFASSPHHISNLIAHKLSKASGIPWVAHLRDPWTLDYHFSKMRLTYILGRILERRIFSSASAIIVVSEGFADFYAKISKRPIYVIHNGYDPEDFSFSKKKDMKNFTIFFAGSIYRGQREVLPLLEAIEELAKEGYLGKFPLKVRLYLPNDDRAVFESQIKNYNSVSKYIEIHDWSDHGKVLKEECEATYLLLPLEFSCRGWYFYTGKLFEYMGAGRPILCLSPRFNLAAKLIIQRGIGVVCESKEEVVAFLRKALKEFYEDGRTVEVPREKIKDFSWSKQVFKISKILEKFSENKEGQG
ncbi:glycosyltransferase [bacterium]|nr:glycosyltransferase [bacterium]